MHRSTVSIFVLAACMLSAHSCTQAQTPATEQSSTPAAATKTAPISVPEPAWVVRSNQYTQMLLHVELKHTPEAGSAQGLSEFDSSITDASRADEIAQRKELEDVLARIKKAEAKEKDRNLRQDVEILQNIFNLQFREEDYRLEHKVTVIDAGAAVYAGIRTLLNDQVSEQRRPSAVIRLRKYTGEEPGFKPFTDILKQRVIEQMDKPGAIYPSVSEMESQVEHTSFYINNLRSLFAKYNVTDWQSSFIELQQELADYDTWVRGNVLSKGRTDSRLTPEEYAFSLQSFDIDLPADQIAAQAHASFTEIQTEMAPLAVKVAKQHGWTTFDYRDVIRQLKKIQITGDGILPFYKARLKAIEEIVKTNNLLTLPTHPVSLRLLTVDETESAQVPAPHFVNPPLTHNTGQMGEFVLPANYPAAVGASYKFDDYTYDAVAWPMTAHEARPGNDLEFNALVQHGISMARVLYAFNSTNIDSWGLYSEWLVQPYEPAEGQLITLQLRLLRAARAFLDFDLHSGKTNTDDATRLLENDVVLSHVYATQEVSQFSSRPPGQAASYFFGYTTMLRLRKDTEAALGSKFNAARFHDFILAQGLLPPDLLRQAVMEVFVPEEKKKK